MNIFYTGTTQIEGVRLVNGSSQYDGNPEVNLGGQWGHLSSDLFQREEAVAFCRTMGKK